jgi:Zc3h12a-like Ribonuclease NYN domain
MLTTLFADPEFEAFAFMAVSLVAVYLLLLLLRRARRFRARHAPEDWILVDGSNVMHWQDNTPQLAPVLLVIEHLKALGYVPGIVFDANAGWKLMDRYLHDGDFARLLAVEKRQVLVVPKGTQADPFLLETAKEFGARIVTNDRFRDWAKAHPRVLERGFLIRGGMRDGKVWMEGLYAVSDANGTRSTAEVDC